MTKLYQEIARCVEARAHCMRNNLPAPRQAHTDRIARMVREHMPSGSGVDNGTALDFDRSTGERLVFICNYHHMNEHGVYDGWTEHTVIVRASLTRDFTLHVTGRDRNDIKAYLGELYHEALSAEVCRHSAVRWTRTDPSDGAHEILTLVRRDAVGDVVVQVTTGADAGDDFVGLYDLDGDQIQLGNETWTVLAEDEVSPDTVAEVEGNWECGSSVVTRISP